MTTPEGLLTGASGFLGRFVLRSLTEGRWQITTLGRSPVEGARSLLADLRTSFDLGKENFTTVYHLAGLAHLVPRTEAEREMYFRVNVEGTRNLLTALERLPQLPESFVLISTVAVYGLKHGSLLDESTPRHASDPYGSSKRQAEDLCIEWCTRHGVRAGIVRLPLVAGPGAPGNLGAMLKQLLRGPYFGIGSGSARRSMVWVRDVANILPRVAACGGVFHLTDGHHPSYAEFEAALCSILGRRVPCRLPLPVARLGALIGDSIEAVAKLRSPFNTRTLQTMTSTLTFSDQRARAMLRWNPAQVLDCVAELVVQP